jgi:replication factor C small subunit
MSDLCLSVNEKQTIWVEKYRPQKICDIVLPDDMKESLYKWKDDGEIPNLLLVSKQPGLGKTSLAHVIINELDAEAMFINASLESNIDLLRSKIQGFVTTISFDGKPKIVILDECDYLNPNSTQPALRRFIEEFSKNCRFILTANYEDKLIEPLRNRLMTYNFDNIYHDYKKTLIKDVFIRNKMILENEGVEYEKDGLINIIKHYYPSSRSIIMKLQQFSQSGKLIIDESMLDFDTNLKKILTATINKDFESTRKLITQIPDPSVIFTFLYDALNVFPKEKQPQIVMLIAKYQSYDAFVRDRSINAVALLTEIMTLL